MEGVETVSKSLKSPVDVLIGMSITTVSVVGSTQIQFGVSPTYLLKCESDVVLETESGTYAWNGVFPSDDFQKLELLIGACVTAATISDVGRLEFVFDNLMKLSVLPNEQFESWQLVGPNGFMVVSLSGGKLALWDSNQ